MNKLADKHWKTCKAFKLAQLPKKLCIRYTAGDWTGRWSYSANNVVYLPSCWLLFSEFKRHFWSVNCCPVHAPHRVCFLQELQSPFCWSASSVLTKKGLGESVWSLATNCGIVFSFSDLPLFWFFTFYAGSIKWCRVPFIFIPDRFSNAGFSCSLLFGCYAVWCCRLESSAAKLFVGWCTWIQFIIQTLTFLWTGPASHQT